MLKNTLNFHLQRQFKKEKQVMRKQVLRRFMKIREKIQTSQITKILLLQG